MASLFRELFYQSKLLFCLRDDVAYAVFFFEILKKIKKKSKNLILLHITYIECKR